MSKLDMAVSVALTVVILINIVVTILWGIK